MAVNARPAWVGPAGICCLSLILFLIAATIVLALIPVYLTARNIDVNRNTQGDTVYAAYASNVNDGTSLRLANPDSVTTQLNGNTGSSGNNFNLQSGNFASARASNRRKRQTLIGSITCERPTGLAGNIFVAQYQIVNPARCFSTNCRQGQKERVLNALRNNYQPETVSMSFTNGETRNVQLVFCTFVDSGSVGGVISPIGSATTAAGAGTISAGSGTTAAGSGIILASSGTTAAGSGTTPTGSNTTPASSVTNSTDCTIQTRSNIYLIDFNDILYEFHPTTLNVTEVGPLNCSYNNTAYAGSISLQRNGILWVLYTDSRVYKYNISSKECVLTDYDTIQSGIGYFTMAFAKNAMDTSETLYISSVFTPTRSLGTIDLTTNDLTVVANYNSSELDADADIKGTNNGRLFLLFLNTTVIIAEVNKTNAEILTKYPVDLPVPITTQTNYRLANYNSNFLVFVANETTTDIYLVNPSANTTTILRTVPESVFGTAVSTCFGTS